MPITVVETISSKFQKKGRLLLERLKKNPDLGWNERGELTIKGQAVCGTNVADLVNDVLRRRKHFEPQGWDRFAEALGDSNIPQNLIGHPD